VLLLSGFFITDVDEMVSCAEENGLMLIKRFEKDEWAAIQLLKKIKK
jgi:ribosomal protein L11 methylase PrmA